MTPRIVATLFSLAVLGAGTVAQAQAIRAVELEYALEPGAARCPSDQVFRDSVNRRISFDPFVKEAPVRLIVTVRHRQGQYYGRAELQGAGEPWSHDVGSPLRDCRTLIDLLGSYVADKLDAAGRRSALDAKPPTARLPAKPPPPLPAKLPPSLERTAAKASAGRSFELRGGLYGNFALLSAPSDLAFEGAVDFGFALSMFALTAEFRGSPYAGRDFPLVSSPGTAPSADDGAEVSTARLAGALVPCLRLQFSKSRLTPFACAVLQAGRVFITGSGLAGGRQVPYGAAGGRLALELNLFKWLTGRVGADFLAPMSRPSIVVRGQTLWETPAFSMTVGAGLGFSFSP